MAGLEVVTAAWAAVTVVSAEAMSASGVELVVSEPKVELADLAQARARWDEARVVMAA
jgi:hypothetical protein